MPRKIQSRMMGDLIEAEVPDGALQLPPAVAVEDGKPWPDPQMGREADPIQAELDAVRAKYGDEFAVLLERKLRPPRLPPQFSASFQNPDEFYQWEVVMDNYCGCKVQPEGSRWVLDDGTACLVVPNDVYWDLKLGKGWDLAGSEKRPPGRRDQMYATGNRHVQLVPEDTVRESTRLALYESFWKRHGPTVALMEEKLRIRREAEKKQLAVPEPGVWRLEVAGVSNAHSMYTIFPPGGKSQYLDSWAREKPDAFKFHRALWSLFPSMMEWAGTNQADAKTAAEWKRAVRIQKDCLDNYHDCEELRCVMRCFRYNFEGLSRELLRRRGVKLVQNSNIPLSAFIRRAGQSARDMGEPREKIARLLNDVSALKYASDAHVKLIEKYIPGEWFAESFGNKPRDLPLATKSPVDLFLDELYGAGAPQFEAEPGVLDESAMPVDWRRSVGARKAAATKKAKRAGRKDALLAAMEGNPIDVEAE